MNKKENKEFIDLARQLKKTDATASIRINDEEKKQLQGHAKSLGLSFSQFILGACRFVKKR